MTVEPTPRPRSGFRARVAFLKELRVVVQQATESRRGWVRRVGILLQDNANRPADMVAPSVAAVGEAQLDAFTILRARLSVLEAPAGVDCRRSALAWLDALLAACRTMAAAQPGNVGEALRATQAAIADSRAALERFEADYARAVAELRQSVDAARAPARPRLRRLFGGRDRPG